MDYESVSKLITDEEATVFLVAVQTLAVALFMFSTRSRLHIDCVVEVTSSLCFVGKSFTMAKSRIDSEYINHRKIQGQSEFGHYETIQIGKKK